MCFFFCSKLSISRQCQCPINVLIVKALFFSPPALTYIVIPFSVPYNLLLKKICVRPSYTVDFSLKLDISTYSPQCRILLKLLTYHFICITGLVVCMNSYQSRLVASMNLDTRYIRFFLIVCLYLVLFHHLFRASASAAVLVCR